jgi:hypothetical protein
MTYREEVYVVDPGTPRDAVEVLLLERFQRVRSELAAGPAGQLVRLAVFDIAFDGPPPRPPLGTLAWKDWRGTPVLGFPFFGIEAPLVTSSLPPRPGSDAPPVAAPPNPVPRPFDSSSVVPPAAPRSNGAASSASSVMPPAPPLSSPVEPVPELLGRRRAADDDLIGELFERLHELVYENGVVEGAGFVLDVLLELIPCDYALVQVFDMNTRKFVVVRARGPGLERALLEATPDSDPAIVEVMRRPDAQQFDAAADPRFQQGRWRHARSAPKRVLSGGVGQSGRYLGLIELGDPAGGQPFNDNEINALSYACGQFAEFVASHPVVIDRDAVLGG